MKSIDLNCDLGEGAAHDEELMPLITSANIACGGHAGDRETMLEAVKQARFYEVGLGAHPGYADRENFGRRELILSPDEIFQLVRDQIEALQAVAREREVLLTHVKPHGALYNQSAKDPAIATAVAGAVRAVNERLILFGLGGSELIGAGRRAGLPVASEVFADRTYGNDGLLTPRDHPQALIADPEAVSRQVMSMVCDGVVMSLDGKAVPITADTICLHGDGADPVGFAKQVRAALVRAGVELRRVSI